MEGGEIQPAYDTIIAGAKQLAPWVRANVPVTIQQVRDGVPFNRMLVDLTELLQTGDVIVAHNALFDMDTALHSTASRLEREKGYRSTRFSAHSPSVRCAARGAKGDSGNSI